MLSHIGVNFTLYVICIYAHDKCLIQDEICLLGQWRHFLLFTCGVVRTII
jgi:hypothetical protein